MKILTPVKVFIGLYLFLVITGSFTITLFIHDIIAIILALWIAGYALIKVYGGIITIPVIPILIPRNTTNYEKQQIEAIQFRRDEEQRRQIEAESARTRAIYEAEQANIYRS